MSEFPNLASEKTCPMCGAAIGAHDDRCQACGEVLISATDDGNAQSLRDQELEAFVGRKAGYYLAKWQRVLDGTGKGTGGLTWLPFSCSGLRSRSARCIAAFDCFYAVIMAESVAEQIVWVGILGHDEVPTMIDQGGNLIAAAICGAYGNRWYLSYAQREIAKVRAEGLPQNEHLQLLSLSRAERIWP